MRESSFVAIWRLKVKSLPPLSDKKLSRASAMLAMKKCNFLCGLLLVNLQAATLINTVQTNVSQHCHASINHSDISFLTSASPLAQSQTPHEMERRGGRGGEGVGVGGQGGEGIIRVSKTGESSCPLKRLMDSSKTMGAFSSLSKTREEKHKQIRE